MLITAPTPATGLPDGFTFEGNRLFGPHYDQMHLIPSACMALIMVALVAFGVVSIVKGRRRDEYESEFQRQAGVAMVVVGAVGIAIAGAMYFSFAKAASHDYYGVTGVVTEARDTGGLRVHVALDSTGGKDLYVSGLTLPEIGDELSLECSIPARHMTSSFDCVPRP